MKRFTLRERWLKLKKMKKKSNIEPRFCVVCDAKFYNANKLTEVCTRPECYRMSRTGETMDDLVREASRMPEFIPNNNHDYDEFDLEKMMLRPDSEEEETNEFL